MSFAGAEEVSEEAQYIQFVEGYRQTHELPSNEADWSDELTVEVYMAFLDWQIDQSKARQRALTDKLIERAKREQLEGK